MGGSIIVCACGLRCEGTPKEALAMYRSHHCRVHDQEPSSPWAMTVVIVAALIFLSFICTHGWGLM